MPSNIAGRNNAGRLGGGVDELGVWNRVLTPQEMAGLVMPRPSMAGLVMDDFNYATSGALRDRLGGLGWAGPWGAGTSGTVTGAVLVDTQNNLERAGYSVEPYGTGRVYGTFSAWREVNRPVAEPMTGEVWFSFLAQTSESAHRAGISINNDTALELNSGGERFNIGLFGNQLRVAVPRRSFEDLEISKVLPDGPRYRGTEPRGTNYQTHFGMLGGLVRLPVRGRDIPLYSNADTPSEGKAYLLFAGGPDGMYSAIQLARFNLSWLLEGERTGDGEIPDRSALE